MDELLRWLTANSELAAWAQLVGTMIALIIAIGLPVADRRERAQVVRRHAERTVHSAFHAISQSLLALKGGNAQEMARANQILESSEKALNSFLLSDFPKNALEGFLEFADAVRHLQFEFERAQSASKPMECAVACYEAAIDAIKWRIKLSQKLGWLSKVDENENAKMLALFESEYELLRTAA